MSETPDERVDRQLAELAKVPWTCVQCGGSPDDHVIGCKVGHAEAVEKVAALEAELEQMRGLKLYWKEKALAYECAVGIVSGLPVAREEGGDE